MYIVSITITPKASVTNTVYIPSHNKESIVAVVGLEIVFGPGIPHK